MRKLAIAFAAPLFLALTACPGPVDTRPGTVTTAPTAIQQARLRCERAYKLSRSLGELGVTAGVVKGALAAQAASLDQALYGALGVCRTAFRSGDLAATIRAADRLDTLSDQADALTKGAGQ